MTTRPALGVVIAVRNRPGSIVNAINSVLQQSVLPDVVVVVDDGSTDGTANEVDRLAKGFDIIRNVTTPHAGPASARNLGLRVLDSLMPTGSGEALVAFLDSDDVWPTDLLFRAHEALRDNPDLGFVVADRLEGFHPSGQRLRSANCFETDPWSALRRQCPQIMSCAVFRRRVLGDRPFPDGSFVGEDAALLIRVLSEGTGSGWLRGAPVVARAIPFGDEERLTSNNRTPGERLRMRMASAETYATAFGASRARVPTPLAGRLLAARWLAALGHGLTARDRRAIARSLSELRRCGTVATIRAATDQCRVLLDARDVRRIVRSVPRRPLPGERDRGRPSKLP